MDPKIFRETLRATARVACCAGLVSVVACQTKTEDSSNVSDSASANVSTNEINVPNEPSFEACMDAIDAGYADPNFDTSTLLDCCLFTGQKLAAD